MLLLDHHEGDGRVVALGGGGHAVLAGALRQQCKGLQAGWQAGVGEGALSTATGERWGGTGSEGTQMLSQHGVAVRSNALPAAIISQGWLRCSQGNIPSNIPSAAQPLTCCSPLYSTSLTAAYWLSLTPSL